MTLVGILEKIKRMRWVCCYDTRSHARHYKHFQIGKNARGCSFAYVTLMKNRIKVLRGVGGVHEGNQVQIVVTVHVEHPKVKMALSSSLEGRLGCEREVVTDAYMRMAHLLYACYADFCEVWRIEDGGCE